MHIACGKNAIYVGALKAVYDNIALFVHSYDICEELCVRNMPYKNKHTVNREKVVYHRF